jgi:hypothetical protein
MKIGIIIVTIIIVAVTIGIIIVIIMSEIGKLEIELPTSRASAGDSEFYSDHHLAVALD